MKIAEKTDRLINFMIDTFIILILLMIIYIIATVLSGFNFYFEHWLGLILMIAYFLYYFLFEMLSGKTPGKMVSGTMVIHRKGKKLKIRHIFFRTLVRFVGLDIYSYLFGTEVGLHDKLSNTLVIKEFDE